jgi:hypothetical protein
MGEVIFNPLKYGSLSGNAAAGGKAAPVAASATGTTGAVVATLPAAANKLTHITGFHVGALGTGGAAVTVAGLSTAVVSGGSLTFEAPAGQTLNWTFDPPLPASADDTAITVTAAANADATAVAVAAMGFQA